MQTASAGEPHLTTWTCTCISTSALSPDQADVRDVTDTVASEVSGKIYGRGINAKTKVAKEQAASQALDKLCEPRPRRIFKMRHILINDTRSMKRLVKEDPDAMMRTLAYLPRFKSYLQNNNLTHRFQWNFSKEGPCHDLTWKCIVLCS